MVSCLTCDHKAGGSIPCQAEDALLIRSKIALFPPFRLLLTYTEFPSESKAKGDDLIGMHQTKVVKV